MKCSVIVAEDGVLCEDCYKTLTFSGVGIGFCDMCGRKIPSGYKEGEICAKCISEPPMFGKLRSAFQYNHTSKSIILGFKHGDRTEYAKPFARWMVLAYGDNIKEIDLIMPVPLHKMRMIKRKYNQAGLLACEISKITGIKWDGLSLKRVKNTKSQGLYRAKGRKSNVKGVFKVDNPGNIFGKTILLIDDVYTTGATVNECAKELLKAGAKQVNVLVTAKV